MIGVRDGKLRFVDWFAWCWILFIHVPKSDDE